MALKAESRLGNGKQKLRFVRGVDAMAANAAYIAAAMSRTLKHHVLARVALQATIVYLPGSCLRRVENL